MSRHDTIRNALVVVLAFVLCPTAFATNGRQASRHSSRNYLRKAESSSAADTSASVRAPKQAAPSASTAGKADQSGATGAPSQTKLGRILVTAHGFPVYNSKLAAVDTAFNAAKLRQLQIKKPGQFMRMVPGVAFTNSQQTGLTFISIRGISQNRNTTSPVVTKLDGVTEISPLQFNQAMYDLDSVEVIKGPEGSLYGPNAVGGAVLINTKSPTNYFTGQTRVDVGNYGQHGVSFGYGGPIKKNRLQFRVAGMYSADSGYFKNVVLNTGENPQETGAARLKLRWLLSNSLRVDFQASYQHTIGTSNYYHYQPAELTADGKLAPGPFPFDFSKVDASQVSQYFYNNNLGLDNYKLYQSHIKVAYDMPFATLTSTSSWAYLNELTEADQFPYTASLSRATLLGNVDGTQTQYFNVRGLTEELRLTSTPGYVPNLHWLVGAYYSYVNRYISSTTGVDKGLGIIPIYEAPHFSSSVNPTLTFLGDDNHNFTRSVLGSIKYDLPAGFTIGAADRYDRVSKNQFVSQQNTAGIPGIVNRANFYKNSPRVTAQWIPNQHVNLYATWGEAFRAGGFNQNGVGKEAAAIGLNGVSDRIKPEVARTVEFGAKTTWLNDRLVVNGDLYHINDQNQPYFVFVGGVGAQVLINIDQAQMNGGELLIEGNAFSSPRLGHLYLYASGSINNSYIRQYALTPSDIGNRLPQAPQRIGHLGFTYQRHVFSMGDGIGPVSLFTRVDFQHTSREAFDADNSTFRKAFNTVNLHLGFKGTDWSLMFSELNATNTLYNEEFVKGGFTEPAPPQRWTISFTRHFGRK